MHRHHVLRAFLTLTVVALTMGKSQRMGQAANDTPVFAQYEQYGGCGGDYVAAGDFNDDSLSDAAVIGNEQLCIFLQAPDTGKMGSPTVLLVPYSYGNRIGAGDFNGDGRDDIVTSHRASDTLRVWLQSLEGTIVLSQTLATQSSPDSLVVADVNSDARDDVIVSHWNAPSIGAFYQNPGGGLAALTAYASTQAGYDEISVGDVNGDGRTDVVKMNGQGYDSPNLLVYTQTIAGQLAAPVEYDLGDINGDGMGVGDITGDGRDDVVMAYGAALAVFAQNELGLLALAATHAVPGASDYPWIIDITLDGRNDLVIAHHGGGVSVMVQSETGVFEAVQPYPVPSSDGGSDVADINADGLPDLLVANASGLAVLYHTTGDLTLTGSYSPSAAPPGQALTLTLVVRNQGPLTATHVSLTNTLPAGSTLVLLLPTQGTCSDTPSISCDLGSLTSGGTVTVTVVAEPPTTVGDVPVSAAVHTVGDWLPGNNLWQANLFVGWRAFLPLAFKPDPAGIVREYPFADRCTQFPIRINNQDKARVTMCVTSVQIRLDRQMKFNLHWTVEFLADDINYVYKGNDAGNMNMNITDNLGQRYDHTLVGGAAYAWTFTRSSDNAEGWYLFPPAVGGASVFTFHDDDQGVAIDGIALVP